MKAIILCAGKGERLRPLTDTTPKPMVKIANRPVLEYLILLCKKHGIKNIAINTSYLPEKIKEYFGAGSKFGVNITYSFEEKLLGTSGALNNFKKFIGKDSFILIYGDTITDLDLKKFIEFHQSKKGIATIAVRKKPRDYKTQSLILADKKNKIKRFFEKPLEEDVEKYSEDFKLINSGIYILEPEILNYIPEGFSDFGFNIFPKLIEAKEKIYCFNIDEYYYREIGKIEKYELAKKEIEEGNKKLNFLNKNKAIFLDRDGVINEHIYETDGKLMSPSNLEQLKIILNVKEGIIKFKDLGFKVIIISNQPGVAFGYIDLKKLDEIDAYLKKELGIDAIYYCPHHEKYTGACECRKPNPFLIFKAAKEFDLDLSESYMAGDSLSDIKTGQNAGVKKNFLIGTIREDIINIQNQKGIFPDFTCKDLIEVAEVLNQINSVIN